MKALRMVVILMLMMLMGPKFVFAKETVVKPAVEVKKEAPVVADDFKDDWSSVRAETKEARDQVKSAKAAEQKLRVQIEKAVKAGDKKKTARLREELKALHEANMKAIREIKKPEKPKKKDPLEEEKKSMKPPRGGKHLESRINPGYDARNRHLDRREKAAGYSQEDK